MAEFVPYFSYDTGKINAAGLALFKRSPKLYTLVIILRAGSILQGELYERALALPAAVRDSIPGWFADWIAMVGRWDSYVGLSGNLIESGSFDPLADVTPGTIPYEFIVKPLLLGKLPDLNSPAAQQWMEITGRNTPWIPWKEQPVWQKFGPGADFGAIFSLLNQLNAMGLTEHSKPGETPWVSDNEYERLGQLLHQGATAGAETLGEGYGVLAEQWDEATKAAADTFSGLADSVGRQIKEAVGGTKGLVILAVFGLGMLLLATRGK